MTKPMFFFHGLGGSPAGNKARFLRQKYPTIVVPQCSADLDERLELALKIVTKPSLIIGSSVGALTALMLAIKKPAVVAGMVLLVPAVGTYNPSSVPPDQLARVQKLRIPAGIPTEVIGAQQDELIPPQSIVNLVGLALEPEQVHLVWVQDRHQLSGSFLQIEMAIEAICSVV